MSDIESTAPDDAAIGQRICEARRALSDSVDEVAERVGVEAATFESWEAGDVTLRANQLPRVAGVLGVSLSWLLMGTGPDPVAVPSDVRQLRSDLGAALGRLDDVVNELSVIDQRLARFES